MPEPGAVGRAEILVEDAHSARRVGSGRVEVFATPMMIALMEQAAVNAVAPTLPPGQETVGTRLEVRHLAATPLGMRVTARAELIKVDGRRLTFAISAADEKEPIEGVHERVIVDRTRFEARAAAKRSA
ncbi:MAG TPA: thioesterase family protein [Burkholderiales bacterium]|nr:thioesterase family protein [Burkholderiales bacterium]